MLEGKLEETTKRGRNYHYDHYYHRLSSIRPKPSWGSKRRNALSRLAKLLGDDVAKDKLSTFAYQEHNEHSLIVGEKKCACLCTRRLVICEDRQPAQTPFNCPSGEGELAESDWNRTDDGTENEQLTIATRTPEEDWELNLFRTSNASIPTAISNNQLGRRNVWGKSMLPSSVCDEK